jgi:carboxymethylenebutenolidase
VVAAAPYYGVIGWPTVQPDWNKLAAKVVGEYAEEDDFASPDKVWGLEADLRALGKDVAMHVHPGTHHAFFNDTRPDVFNEGAAKTAFARTLDLFASTL